MSAILFNENSELLPVTRQKLIKLCETLKQYKLTPWLWFNSRGVKVPRFDGGTIDISGTPYGQSQANVFWQFIVPFLEDAIVKTLDETIETCRARGLKPEEPYIRETAMLLDGYLIDPIYRYMADIDRGIRGKGKPKSVGRKDVTDEITEMVKFLDERKDEIIQGIKEADLASTKQKDGEAKSQNLIPMSQLIAQGESHTLEFKETLEYSVRDNKQDKNLNKECLKTIAAFLNTDGGTLLIGVRDNGEITGIEQDLQYVQRKNLDGFERKLRDLVKSHFTPNPFGKVKIRFEKLTKEIVCRVDVNPVNRNQIIHFDNEVYIRDGNITRKLEGRDLTDWIQQRGN